MSDGACGIGRQAVAAGLHYITDVRVLSCARQGFAPVESCSSVKSGGHGANAPIGVPCPAHSEHGQAPATSRFAQA